MRQSWIDYFFTITKAVASRSTCTRRQVGAIAVKDRRVLATGYNGAPSGIEHCSSVGCIRQKRGIPSGEQLDICRALHAEQNLIIQAAKYGISLEHCTVFCTHKPCFTCAKMLVQLKVKEIHFINDYPDENSSALFAASQIPTFIYREVSNEQVG